MGFVYVDFSVPSLVISLIIALIPVLYLPADIKRASHLVNWVLYLIVVIPSSFVPFFVLSQVDPAKLILLEAMLVLNLYILDIFTKIPLIQIPKFNIKAKTFNILIIVIYILMYGYLIKVYGFSINLSVLTNLANVYDLRENYRASSDTISIYFLNWLSKVINPIFIVIGLCYKKYHFLIFGFIAQLLLFMISGHKTFLFSILLLFGLWIAVKNHGKGFGLRLISSLAFIVFIAYLYDSLVNDSLLTSLFVRRLIVVPGMLTGYYYEFFSNNPKPMWSYSFMSIFMNYMYDLKPAFLIGKVYFNDPETSANANLWADAFANLGFIGMFFMSMILGFILWIFDSIVGLKHLTFNSLFIGMAAINLTNTSLLTGILTHGLFLVIIIAYILPKEYKIQRS